MVRIPQNKADLLSIIEEETAAWRALLAEVGEDRMLLPGVGGEWTFKDVVAHLNGWRARTVNLLGGAVDRPFPADLTSDEDSDVGVEEINRWIHDANENRLAADV